MEVTATRLRPLRGSQKGCKKALVGLRDPPKGVLKISYNINGPYPFLKGLCFMVPILF